MIGVQEPTAAQIAATVAFWCRAVRETPPASYSPYWRAVYGSDPCEPPDADAVARFGNLLRKGIEGAVRDETFGGVVRCDYEPLGELWNAATVALGVTWLNASYYFPAKTSTYCRLRDGVPVVEVKYGYGAPRQLVNADGSRSDLPNDSPSR